MEHPLTLYLTAGAIISSLGFTAAGNMRNIRDGQLLHKGGRIDNGLLWQAAEARRLGAYTRMEQLFILSIADVVSQSGIDITSPDCLLALSTTKGNVCAPLPAMGARIAAYWGMDAQPVIISNACISGLSAMIVASRLIREGRYKYAVVAGGDELSRFVVAGFESFRSVSPSICRPYDKDRDGLSLGEACGALLITADRRYVRDAKPVVLEGGCITNDANHISGPSRTGDGLYLAISGAMEENHLSADDISFVNAHGTATVYNDEMESKALHLAGLDDKPLNSLKPYWGHTLGASGIIETIACMEELRSGEVFGTPGFKESNLSHPLNVHAEHQPLTTAKRCIKTASGFGGCNAAVSLALEPYSKAILPHKAVELQQLHSCTLYNNEIIKDGATIFKGNKTDDFTAFIRAACKATGANDLKFYKMDDLCKLGYVTASYLLSDINLAGICRPEQAGIILSNASASLDTDLRHQHTIDTLGDTEASPAQFVYTLPNIVAGEICIRHKIKGENTFFINSRYDEPSLLQYAAIAMKHQNLRACVTGWCELLNGAYKASFRLLIRIGEGE